MLEDFKWFFLYLFGWKRGIALVHVYVWEHIVSLNYRITWWIFTQLGRDKILMTPHICIDVLAKSAQEPIQGRGIIGQWGPLLQRTSSLDGRLQQQTECIAIIKKHLGRSVVIFCFIQKSNFWCVFGLSRFGVLLCNFFRFLCGKELYLH